MGYVAADPTQERSRINARKGCDRVIVRWDNGRTFPVSTCDVDVHDDEAVSLDDSIIADMDVADIYL